MMLSRQPSLRSLRSVPRPVVRPGEKPDIVTKCGLTYDGVWTHKFKHERTAPEVSENNRKLLVVRIANAFAFVNTMTFDMVKLGPDDGNNRYSGVDLIGFIAPLNCGSRRGGRYLSGHTPFYRERSSSAVWGQEGAIFRVKVKWPLVYESFHIILHDFETVGIQSDCSRITYMLQHPDPKYKATYEQMVQEWGDGRWPLFKSVDLHQRCPSWLNTWVYQMMRLECKVILQVAGNEVEEGAEEMIEDGVSDAESVPDTRMESSVPTSITWVWPEARLESTEVLSSSTSQPSDVVSTLAADESPLFTDSEYEWEQEDEAPAEPAET
ncbi:hypothetical protein RSOL_284790, partial [Rhizoctonia solani AG-3 Rhs1AP]